MLERKWLRLRYRMKSIVGRAPKRVAFLHIPKCGGTTVFNPIIAFGVQPTDRVGVVGVGIGTLASYGRPGDYYRLYEIDPLVIDVAREHFSFLSQTAAQTEIVLGDARLQLDIEAPQQFDVLVVDAGGQLDLLPEALEDTDFTVLGLGHNHMEAVGAQVDCGDQGQILGLGLRHGQGVSVDNLDIVPRSNAGANAQCSKP